MTMYPTIGDQQYLGHDSYHSYLINIRMEYIYWMRPTIRPALVRKGWTYPGTTQVTPVTPFGHRGHQVDARHPHLQWKRAVTFAEPCETTTCSKTKKGHFYGIRSHHYHQYIMIIPYYTSFLIRWGHFSWHLVEKKACLVVLVTVNGITCTWADSMRTTTRDMFQELCLCLYLHVQI
jgi:hypothetical protein